MNYNEFLHTKVQVAPVSGFGVRPEDVHTLLILSATSGQRKPRWNSLACSTFWSKR